MHRGIASGRHTWGRKNCGWWFGVGWWWGAHAAEAMGKRPFNDLPSESTELAIRGK